MLKSKWNSLLKFNSVILYSLALLPPFVLKENHIKPFSDYQKHILDTYYSRGRSVPYSYIKLFTNNSKALNMVLAYYKNIKRNHNLVRNLREFLRLDFTTKSTDKAVHLYTLEVTAKPYGYHVYRTSSGQFVIVDASGQSSYQNWTSALHRFKSSKLKRTNTAVLGSMPHCKPNLTSLLELHAHINLFSAGQTTLTQSAITDYFTRQLGFSVSAHLRPMRNVLTGQPIVFDQRNYDEPIHCVTVHDSHMDDTNDTDDIQHTIGNDYDSVEVATDKSGQPSDPLSVPDKPKQGVDQKSLSNVDVLTGLGLRGIAEYALATISSSYGITRRFTFSYKQTGIYRHRKHAIKQSVSQLVLAGVALHQPSIDDTADRQRAICAVRQRRDKRAVAVIKTYLSEVMANQPADVINEAWANSLYFPYTCYEDGLQLDYPAIWAKHGQLVDNIRVRLGQDFARFVSACVAVITSYITRHRRQSMKSAAIMQYEPYINKKAASNMASGRQLNTYLNKSNIQHTITDRMRASGIPP